MSSLPSSEEGGVNMEGRLRVTSTAILVDGRPCSEVVGRSSVRKVGGGEMPACTLTGGQLDDVEADWEPWVVWANEAGVVHGSPPFIELEGVHLGLGLSVGVAEGEKAMGAHDGELAVGQANDGQGSSSM